MLDIIKKWYSDWKKRRMCDHEYEETNREYYANVHEGLIRSKNYYTREITYTCKKCGIRFTEEEFVKHM